MTFPTLQAQMPIVHPNGNPTLQFMRYLQMYARGLDTGANVAGAAVLTLAAVASLPNARTAVFSGGLTATDAGAGSTYTVSIADTAVTAASYGAAGSVATFTVNQRGQLTAAGTVTISITATQISNSTAAGRAALTGLDASTGLVEQTGATAFAKRALGVAAGTSVPTRADADARYVLRDFGAAWTAWTGTASRATAATYTAPAISVLYTQSEVQAIADGLQAVSRAMMALIDDLKANGALA